MAGIDEFAGLFTPFKIRGATFPNRIVMPAMGLEACHNGLPGPAVAAHCAARIRGGIGLVMTELWHVGLIYKTQDVMEGEALRFRPELRQVSPSGFIEPRKKVSEGMTHIDIDEVIEAYGVGADMAKSLGFDGLEIHAGHGYFIDQFLWSPLNQRRDRYGGTPRARGQFGAEVVAECRRRVGPDFPILFSISNWKLIDYAACLAETPDELGALLAPLAEAGGDAFDCSQRRFWEPVFDASKLNLAGWVKKLTGVATMTVGSMPISWRAFLKAARPTATLPACVSSPCALTPASLIWLASAACLSPSRIGRIICVPACCISLNHIIIKFWHICARRCLPRNSRNENSKEIRYGTN